MAKIHRPLPLKDTYEWRYKTTLEDAFEATSVIFHHERRIALFLVYIAFTPLWLQSNTPWLAVSGLGINALIFVLADIWFTRHLTAKRLFICREGLGLDDGKTFKTMAYPTIQKVRFHQNYILIENEDEKLTITQVRYPKKAIEGLIQILKAEGHPGEAYPYRVYFTPGQIRVEEKESHEELSTHERFSKIYRYYVEGSWDTIELQGAKLLQLKRLKNRTAAIHFKSIKVTANHPLNGSVKAQKTDPGLLVFNAFEVLELLENGQAIVKPFKTLKSLIENMVIEAVTHENDAHAIHLKKAETPYVLRFTAAAFNVGFNALEEDAWYRL